MSVSTGRIGCLCFLMLCAVSLLAQDSAPVADAAKGTWQVEILVFSGRPNPVFSLDPAEVLRMEDLRSQAPTVSTVEENTTVLPSILGYRGLSIRQLGTNGQVISETQVYGRQVLTRDAAQSVRTLTDNDDLERYLVDLALSKGSVSESVHATILSSERKDQ